MRYNIFCLILLILIPAAAFAQDINIQGGAKDAMISSAADTLNYGASKVAKAGRKTGNDTLRFLYQSDVLLARIPPGATIDSVVFKLYQCSTATDTSIGSGFLFLKWLDSAFAEGTQDAAKDTINWKRKLHGRESNVTAWPTAGGSFNSTKIDSQAFAQATDSIAFHDDSLDALVQRWVNGTQANRGFIITSSDESQNEIWVFATSDSTGRQPRWEIWYTVASPTWAKKYLSQDSSGVTDWIPDYDVDVGNADNADSLNHIVAGTYATKNNAADSARSIASDTADAVKNAMADSALIKKHIFSPDSVWAFIPFTDTRGDIWHSNRTITETNVTYFQNYDSLGGAASFNGSSSLATLAGITDSTKGITVEFTIYPRAMASNNHIVNMANFSTGKGWSILLDNSGLVAYQGTAESFTHYYYTAYPITIKNRYDVQVVFYSNGTRPLMYVNGKVATVNYDVGTPPTALDIYSSTIYIGRRVDVANSYYNGLIQNLTITHREKTVDELMRGYQVRNGNKFGIATIDSSNTRTSRTTGNAYFNMAFKSMTATADSEYTTIGRVRRTINDSSRFPLDTTEIDVAGWEQFVKDHQDLTSSSSTGNPDSLGGHPASYYAHKAPGVISLHPAFPMRSYKILSVDTTVSATVGLSGDSIVQRFTGTATAKDSLRMTVLIPLPGDFSAFHSDSALTIRWWGSGNSTDSSYLELDAYLYPLTAELDSAKLASNKAWNTILVKAAALATNTWSGGKILRLNFTLGVKENHDVLIERIVMKYTRQ